jgi:hypothetical protein
VFFARQRGLSVGDSLSLTLRDLPDTFPDFVEIVDTWHQAPILSHVGILRDMVGWETRPTHGLELEIVGLYRHHYEIISYPFIFVPESIIPLEFRREGTVVYNAYYSFVLKSTRYQQAFLEENEEALLALGFEVEFFEHNAERFWALTDPIIHSGRINAMVFCGIFVLILALISTIFIIMGRRSFAILRALGCPAKVGFKQMLAPVVFAWLPLLLIGSFLARHVAIAGAYESMAAILEIDYSFELGEHFSVFHVLVLWLILAIVTLVLFSIGVLTLARQSVLDLLQGSGRNVPNNKKLQREVEAESNKRSDTSGNEGINKQLHYFECQVEDERIQHSYCVKEFPETRDRYIRSAVGRYVYRHILRLPIRTILSMGLALFFVVAIGLLDETIRQSEREVNYLYDTTIVTLDVRNAEDPEAFLRRRDRFDIIRIATIEKILGTGYIQDVYLEAGKHRAFLVNHEQVENLEGELRLSEERFWPFNYWYAFSDIETYLYEHSERWINAPPGFVFGAEHIQIEFGAGYTESDFVFDKHSGEEAIIPVVVGESLMELRRLSVGDTAYIITVAGPPRLFEVSIIGTTKGWTVERSPLTKEHMVSMPIEALEMIQGSRMNYVSATFTLNPARNRELAEFREKLEDIREQSIANIAPLRFDLRDEELRMVVEPLEQTLQLLKILYPIIIVISLLVALGFSALLILQNAKNVAVMRVLGIKNRTTRTKLILGQMTLCVIGLALGLIVFSFIGGTFGVSLASQLFAGLYLVASLVGSIIGAIVVSNRSPLELLQVKE